MRTTWKLALLLLVIAFLTLGGRSVVALAEEAATSGKLVAVADDEAETEDDADEDGDDDDDADTDAADDDEGSKAEDAESQDETDKAEEKKSAAKEKGNEQGKDEEDKQKRKTHTVKAGPLKIQFESDGVFVAREMTEVELDPETWSEFEIVEIVPHGASVHKGQVLVKFDGEKLEEAIDDLELDQKINELSLMKAEEELPRLEKSIKDAYEQAERSLAEAKVDYENYQQTDRDMIVKQIEMSLKSTEQAVENAREELRQLEKMYEADDLTEETEEIILQRQRADVEQYEFMLERAKLSHDRNLGLFLPRNDIAEKEYLERVELAFERAKTALATDVSRARYDLEKSRQARAKSLERHAKLTSDRGLLTIKSPADGVVYYGECTDGEWSDTASLISKLKPESKAPTGSALMTIVGPADLYVISSVKEANRTSVEEGQAATIEPTATDSPKLEARVSELSNIPVASGKFSMELEIHSSDVPEWLVAGMTGKVKVTTYEKKQALMVPKDAVHSEEADEDAKYVWLVEGDKAKKQSVKTGKTKDDKIEIVDGLDKGDVVSLDDEDKKSKDD